jgi:RHS repeat-associated protein
MGVKLSVPATLLLERTQAEIDALGENPQLVCVRLQETDLGYGWVLQSRAEVEVEEYPPGTFTYKLRTYIDGANPIFNGVKQGGTFLFLKADSDMGFIKGTVTQETEPLTGALVSLNNHDLLAVSGPNYTQVGFLGALTLTALNPETRDEVDVVNNTLDVKGEIIVVYINIEDVGPSVDSISPSDAEEPPYKPANSIITIRFSEPIDAATFNAQSVYVKAGTETIAGTFKMSDDGKIGYFVPEDDYPSGSQIDITVNAYIKDLAGNGLAPPGSGSFKVVDTTPIVVDPSAITISLPDEFGKIHVVTTAAMLNAGDSVTVYNDSRNTSVTFTSQVNGSAFDVDILADLSDKIRVVIRDEAGNETELPEKPFVSADGKRVIMDERAWDFINEHGLGIKIEAGTFDGVAEVGLDVELDMTSLAQVPPGFERLKAIRVDFPTRYPLKPFKLSIELPEGQPLDGEYYIAREVEVFGEAKLMVVDTVSVKDGRLETNSPPWPGAKDSGVYSFLYNQSAALGFIMGNTGRPFTAVETDDFVYITDLSDPDFLVPVIIDGLVNLSISDLDTGEIYYTGTVEGPTFIGETYDMGTSTSTDKEAPALTKTTGIHSFFFDVVAVTTSSGTIKLEPQKTFEKVTGVKITGAENTAINVEDAVTSDGVIPGKVGIYKQTDKGYVKVELPQDTAGIKGEFVFTVHDVKLGDRFMLTAEQGDIPTGKQFVLTFNEPLKEFTSDENTAQGTIKIVEVKSSEAVTVLTKISDNKREVLVSPAVQLKEETRYRLEVNGIEDNSGNTTSFSSHFRTQRYQAIDTQDDATEVNDSVRLGSYLYVAAGEAGINVMDVSNPTNVTKAGEYNNFAGSSGAKGLALWEAPDGKQKLIVVGAGVNFNGFLRILDLSVSPTKPAMDTYMYISRSPYSSYRIPEGVPRSVFILDDYAFVPIYGAGLQLVDLAKLYSGADETLYRLGLFEEPNAADVKAYYRGVAKTDEGGNIITEIHLTAVLASHFKGIRIVDFYNKKEPVEVVTVNVDNGSTSIGFEDDKDNPINRTHAMLGGLALVTDYELEKEEDTGGIEISKNLVFFTVVGLPDVYVLDITNLDENNPRLIKKIRIDEAGGMLDMDMDQDKKTLAVTDWNNGLVLLDMAFTREDFSKDLGKTDTSQDRVIAKVHTSGSSRTGLVWEKDLNIAYVGQEGKGVDVVLLEIPIIRLVYLHNNQYMDVPKIAPLGLEDDDNPVDPVTGVKSPSTVYAMASLPGGIGKTIKAVIRPLNYAASPIVKWDDSLVKTEEEVTMTRLSDDRKSDNYKRFLSEPIAVTVDPTETSGKTIMSGFWIEAAFDFEDDDTASRLSYIPVSARPNIYARVRSIPSEYIEGEKPEPANNPSTGMGEVSHSVPGFGGAAYSSVYLHSGEFFTGEVDMAAPGTGFGFAFARHYDSQSVYSGVLGWGWDHNYNRRVVELYNGDVLYFGGNGRRERYTLKKTDGLSTEYDAPDGYFTELKKRPDGTYLLKGAQGFTQRFNAFGRLELMQDTHGNKMYFYYDFNGRLSIVKDTGDRYYQFEYWPMEDEDIKANRIKTITDYNKREVSYEYDNKGDLTEVKKKDRKRTYEYKTVSGNIRESHNIVSFTDARERNYMGIEYKSGDKVERVTIGNDAVTVEPGASASTTDAGGITRDYTHNDENHMTAVSEGGAPLGEYKYNKDGLVTSVKLPLGNETQYEYDSGNSNRRSQGNLRFIKSIPAGGGDILTTEYKYKPGVNRVNYIKDPKDNETVLSVDGRNGNVENITYPGNENSTYRYTYYKHGQLWQIIAPYEKVTEYAYYADTTPVIGGYVKKITVDKGGDNISSFYEYDEKGRLSFVADGRGGKTFYNDYNDYDEAQTIVVGGQTSEDQRPVSVSTGITYHDDGTIHTKTSRGITTTYYYTLRNQLDRVVNTGDGGAIAHTYAFVYNGSGSLSRFINPRLIEDTYTYYAGRSLLHQKSFGNGLTTYTYEYDSNNRLNVFKDGRDKPYTYNYDGYGRMESLEDPLGNKVKYTYDANSNVESVEGADDSDNTLAKVIYEYNTVNGMSKQKVQTQAGGENITQFDYNDALSLKSVTNPNNHVYKIDFDLPSGSGLPHLLEDPMNNKMKLTHDTAGLLKMTESTDASGKVKINNFTHNALGQPGIENYGMGRKYESFYNAKQQLEQQKDPEDGAVEYKYDGMNRLEQVIRYVKYKDEIKPFATIYTYDENNNLVTIEDPKKNVTTYKYDNKDRLERIEYPGGLFTHTTYNGNDQVLTHTDLNGTIVTNTYDDAGRLTDKTIQRGEGVEGPVFEAYTYDALGRVLTAKNDHSIVVFTYNKEGNIVSETLKQYEKDEQDQEVITFEKTVQSTAYDANGNRTTLTYPSGKILTITPDALDRISTIKEGDQPIVGYTYADQNNGKFSKTLRNVIQKDVTLDDVDRPHNITHKELGSNTEISNRTLDWTKTDLKNSELNTDGSGETNAYDSAKRLREQADTEKNTGSEYDIDDVDNVTVKKETKKGITTTTDVKVNERNQLTELNGIPVIHDNNGNLTSYKNQYTYDWKNQLVKVVTSDGKTIDYKYDAIGRRVRKTVTETGTVTKITNFVWDGWRVIEEYDGDEELTSRYVYGNGLDERVEIEKKNSPLTPYIPMQNNIGSVIAIADTGGNIVERYTYSNYGTPTFIYDNQSPQVDVVRIEAGNLFIRFSEPVDTDKAESAVTIKRGVDVIPGTFTFEDSDQFMKFTPSEALPQNESLTITVAVTLEDKFKNTLEAEFNESFTYTGADMIIYDRAAPVVEEIRVYEGNLYVTCNESLAPVSLTNSIELQSPQGPITGTISYENSRILKFVPSQTFTNDVEYTVTVKTTAQDLSSKALPEELTAQFTYKGTDLIIYEEPSEHEHKESLKRNTYLFQGRTYEPESGLYYYRHRYLHPELGRFLQTDPMGYHDSMNMYQAFNNNPANYTDPMGLTHLGPTSGLFLNGEKYDHEEAKRRLAQQWRGIKLVSEGATNAAIKTLLIPAKYLSLPARLAFGFDFNVGVNFTEEGSIFQGDIGTRDRLDVVKEQTVILPMIDSVKQVSNDLKSGNVDNVLRTGGSIYFNTLFWGKVGGMIKAEMAETRSASNLPVKYDPSHAEALMAPVEIQFNVSARASRKMTPAQKRNFIAHLAEQEAELNALSLYRKTDLQLNIINYKNVSELGLVDAARRIASNYLKGNGSGLHSAHKLDAVAGGYIHNIPFLRDPVQSIIGSLWKSRVRLIKPGRRHKLTAKFSE